MFKFDYLRPATVAEACAMLLEHGENARPIAGGTDLMVQFHEKNRRWEGLRYVVDLSAVTELRGISETEKTVEIGALTTHTELNTSALLRKYADFLAAAAGTVGSPQIRNLGTIGGSVGNASPAADPLTPLIALDAKAVIAGKEGSREVLVRDLYVKSGVLDLKPGELITRFVFEKPAEGAHTHFEKLGRRKALAISRMNVSVLLGTDGSGVIRDARICPGCVFAVPDRVTTAEALLLGAKPDEALFAKAGMEVSAEMIRRTGVRWSTEYKQPVIEALTQRALMKAMGMEAE